MDDASPLDELLFFDAVDSFSEAEQVEDEPVFCALRRRRSRPTADPPLPTPSASTSSSVTAGPQPPPPTVDLPSLSGILLLLATDPYTLLSRVWTEVKRRLTGGLAARLAVGALWASFVGIALLWCLAVAFLIGWILVARIVEEPVRIEEELVFDYTRESPVAVVLLSSSSSCGVLLGGFDKEGNDGGADMRLIGVGNRLLVTIFLTLPESDYNRNLGVFQVRADFLSSSGHIIASSSRPCMLQFKSPLVRFLQTLLKSGLLLAGYSSESQILRIEMNDFTEKRDPTACIRIAIQSRAQFQRGTGIPEIYAASLSLESELPLVKRILWSWRRTIFIWISLGLFLTELLIILLCCRPLIIPKMTVGSAT